MYWVRSETESLNGASPHLQAAVAERVLMPIIAVTKEIAGKGSKYFSWRRKPSKYCSSHDTTERYRRAGRAATKAVTEAKA